MITRRSFVRGSTAFVGLGLFAPGLGAGPRARSLAEELRIAVVGLRGRGNDHVRSFWNVPNVRVVAVCDVDTGVLGKRADEYAKAEHPVETCVDLRELLDRDDIDAISIASPNHQHAPQAVWACQAGKDVYLEKPVSHNVWEGGQIVKAARKYDRVVMTGTQCRSSQAIAEAIEWIQAGNLGAIQVARGLCYKPRKSIGKVPEPQSVPASVDYDLWCGPAPKGPLMREQLHYDWHWVFDTGNGDLGNQGIHQMDIARWALGEPDLPPSVFSVGGRFGYDDDGNTPNTQVVVLGYEKAPLIFEVRGLPRDRAAQESAWNGGGMDDFQGAKIGVVVQCEDGHLLVSSYDSAIAFDGEGNELQRWKGSTNHYAHFADIVRSRELADSRADIREGHVSSALCHMGNVSHHLGQSADPDAVRESFQGNSAALESWSRMRAHLDANGVDLERTPATLGPWLAMDPKTERFEADRANALLARDYRAPFIVPEIV
jgi:predicted dehydrogenase